MLDNKTPEQYRRVRRAGIVFAAFTGLMFLLIVLQLFSLALACAFLLIGVATGYGPF